MVIEALAPRATERRVLFRYYMWVEGRVFRITNKLHSDLLEGAIRLPQFANTSQRIIEATVDKRPLVAAQVHLKGSTYAFDGAGRLDLSDQVEAIRGITGPDTKGNVVGIANVLAHQRWRREHSWSPPSEAVEDVLMDILPERRTDGFRPLPFMRGVR